MASRRLLLSLAHPDDESFGYGALISKYVAEGVDVYLIVSTDGDVGTILPEFMDGYNSIAERRLAELDCANQILGFKQIFRLGYKDSGMMGSETSKDPACSWQAPREEMARKVVEIIREVRPQVVLTFNKFGGYGHPDHIAIQRATTDAIQLAGDAAYDTGEQAPYQPQKLYYSSFPSLRLRYNILMSRLRGNDPRRLGRNKDIDLVAILDHIEPPNTRVTIHEYFDQWEAASACHASQLGGGRGQPPRWFRRMFMNQQGFTRIFPAPGHERVDEHDLFDNVTADEPLGVV